MGVRLFALAFLALAPYRVGADELTVLLKKCTRSPNIMAGIVKVESGGNPFAIGVVSGHLVRQPRNRREAIATAKALEAAGWNFSVGIAQVNKFNLSKYGLSYERAFNSCENLRVGSAIFEECYKQAQSERKPSPLDSALSCYYSGNFERGFQSDGSGQPYVAKVLRAMEKDKSLVIPVISTRNQSKRAVVESPVLVPKTDRTISEEALVF